MITDATYTCEYCGAHSTSQKEIAICEDRCARHKTFLDVEAIREAQAYAYLDTIRLRAVSFEHLFKMIIDEEDMIREAVKLLYYKDKRQPPRMYNFNWEFCHFCNVGIQFRKECMTHSAPIGQKKHGIGCDYESRRYSPASSIRIHFNHKGSRKEVDAYEKYIGHIPGVNTGSGGGVEKVNYYCTLWAEDFPLIPTRGI